MDVLSPGPRSTPPDLDGSDRLYVPSLTVPEMLVITKVADKSTLQNTDRSSWPSRITSVGVCVGVNEGVKV